MKGFWSDVEIGGTSNILKTYHPALRKFFTVTNPNQQAFTLSIILTARYYSYYIHLARRKSETPRLNDFIVLLETNFNVKEKLLLKPETTPNKEISGPPYAFLICVRKPHEKKQK